jgi:hypothetical protein
MVMDSLAVVQSYVGEVKWPLQVLTDKFLEEPKDLVIRRVAAFMYGDYVTVSDAVLCYNTCNGMHRRYVDRSQQEWYELWDRDVGKEDEYYYSTTLKGMVCLKTGKANEHLSVRKFVPEGTAFPRLKCAQIHCIPSGMA